MSSLRPATLAGIALALLYGPAFAQIQQLPATSRSEAQASALNNGLVIQGQNRQVQQQNQFELNAIRQENSVRSVAPSIVVAPPIAGPAR